MQQDDWADHSRLSCLTCLSRPRLDLDTFSPPRLRNQPSPICWSQSMMNISQDPRETLSTLLTWFLYISCSALVAKIVSTLAWRLWFHPLAAVPGPRVAAVCSLWEAWQDIGRGGELARAVFELHREYSMCFSSCCDYSPAKFLRQRHCSHVTEPCPHQ